MKPDLGRPRAFDKDDALNKATHVFWVSGYHGASLANLTKAMGINKPSLYAAFGNKTALYTQALSEYGTFMQKALRVTLEAAPTLERSCESLLRTAVNFYTPEGRPHLGCLIANVSITPTPENQEFADALLTFLGETDALIADILQNTFPSEVEKTGLTSLQIAQLLTSTTHSLSLRARAGVQRKALIDMAQLTVRLIFR